MADEGLRLFMAALDAAEARDLRLQCVEAIGRLRRVSVAGGAFAGFGLSDVYIVRGVKQERVVTVRDFVVIQSKAFLHAKPRVIDEC